MRIKTYISHENINLKYYKKYYIEYWVENISEFKKKSENIRIESFDSNKRVDLVMDKFNYITLNGYIFDDNKRPIRGKLISIYNISTSDKAIIHDVLTDSMGMFQIIMTSDIDINLIRIKISNGQDILT
ncbi:hypothetical protein SAMN02745163_02033 [Clostridium cavendishii DSM 21758]|uniref:Uncharacterized protein n=1 Tax=Clostridium cavendishii DSM 21758 TaxID=1121302 RepID=A0A1M6JHB7_9CLOT|nr:hypothetical protein [Clostridium cavendishii]SHJ46128.1 hypothetical protein SAMN02745163_02033 [Clostridium cavendishii DSM 21758]